MFSKLFSASETTPILPSTAYSAASTATAVNADANAVAQAGVGMVHETVNKIKTLNQSAPYSFRVLGLVGGVAMIASNSLMIVGRLLTFNLTGAVIAFYCFVFGIIIVLLEADHDTITCPNSILDGRRLQEGVRFYAKFLEYTWGRGVLYFFVGTLQFANWDLMDWIVGGWMMAVGAMACAAGVKTAHDLRRLRLTIRNERDLKEKFKKYDKHNHGYWGIKELSEFIADSGLVMSQNEVVSAYMALNKNFDDKLRYEELVDWWTRPSRGDLGFERVSV